MKKGVRLKVIIFGVLFLVAIAIILFLTLKGSSGKLFTIVSQEECALEGEKCIKLIYKDFNCEDFSGSDYTYCMSIDSYFDENIELCEELKGVSDGEMVMVCLGVLNYCMDENDKNFKFYEGVINMDKYVELCGK